MWPPSTGLPFTDTFCDPEASVSDAVKGLERFPSIKNS